MEETPEDRNKRTEASAALAGKLLDMIDVANLNIISIADIVAILLAEVLTRTSAAERQQGLSYIVGLAQGIVASIDLDTGVCPDCGGSISEHTTDPSDPPLLDLAAEATQESLPVSRIEDSTIDSIEQGVRKLAQESNLGYILILLTEADAALASNVSKPSVTLVLKNLLEIYHLDDTHNLDTEFPLP